MNPGIKNYFDIDGGKTKNKHSERKMCFVCQSKGKPDYMCSIIPGREVTCSCGRTVHGTCAQVLRSQGPYKCPVCKENELNFLQMKTAGKLTSKDVDYIFGKIFGEDEE